MQLGFPSDVSITDVMRKPSLGKAIELCAESAGLDPKVLQLELGWDKAQWSRWESGQEGITWPKFQALMDRCGNDAPVLWMLFQRGYDLTSLRKTETETEKALRLANERIQQLEHEREVERRLFRDLRTAA